MKTDIKEQYRKSKKINIDFNFSTDIENKIVNWRKENIFFGVFPTVGDSMTCNDRLKSIPCGSKVLVYDLQINFNIGLDNVWHQIPINEPILIIGKTNDNRDFRVCKTISCVDAVNGWVSLKSYNPLHKSVLIPFDWITSILKVEQIINNKQRFSNN